MTDADQWYIRTLDSHETIGPFQSSAHAKVYAFADSRNSYQLIQGELAEYLCESLRAPRWAFRPVQS